MTAPDRVDVFISYRHGEANSSWIRHVLVPALEEEDFTFVLDETDFAVGDNLMDAMEDASERALLTLAIISDGYGASGMVNFERQLANRLVAVLRDPDEEVPPAAAVVDLTDNQELDTLLAELHRLLKRVFVLHADEDREWVEGVLLAMLDDAGVRHQHSGALPPGGVWKDETEAAMAAADRVIVVVSAAYLRETHGRAETLVTKWEAEHRGQRKLLPIVLDDGLEVPKTFDVRLFVRASKASMWDAALARVCREVGVPFPVASVPPACPYPGLRPYDEERSEVFFGRKDEIEEALAHLRNQRFVAIIGPSGSGKSSLAVSGVAHIVKQRGLDASGRCSVAVMRPGSDPLAALGEALTRLDRGGTGASTTTGVALLVVDQLEELFTVGAQHADEFLTRVDELLRTDPRLNVVVTMRADFYPHAMECTLWPRIAASRCEILPPSGDRLRDAIREPALARRVIVDEALVERLAAETEGQPGLLPFLQEALVALWGRMTWRLLSLYAYRDMAGSDDAESGILQAIRRQADSTTSALEAEHPGSERVVRAIFLSLVQFGEGRADTRRRQPVAALRALAGDDETFTVVFDRLVAERLITPDRGVNDEPVADLAHEAIIDGWQALREWVKEGRVAERERRHLLERGQEWEQRVGSGKPLVGLLEDVELTEAERWSAGQQAAGTFSEPLIADYIRASRDLVTRRRRRRRTAIFSGFVVLLLVAAVLALATVTARRAQHDAERETVRRTALQLAASAAALPSDRLSLRALLVRAADEIEPTGLSRAEMLATAERTPAIVERRERARRNVSLDALWVDDDRAVVGASNGELQVWRMAGGHLSSRPMARVPRASQPLLAIARQPGTDRYAVGGGTATAEGGELVGRNGGVELLDLSAHPPRLRPVSLPGSSVVSAVTFVDDLLLIGRWDGTVVAIDVRAPRPKVAWEVEIPQVAPDPTCAVDVSDRKVRGFAFAPSERLLAVASNNCLISVWELPPGVSAPGSPRLLTGHQRKVRALEFVPGTTRLLSTGDDGSVRAWDVTADEVTRLSTTQGTDDQRTLALCVSPDGKLVTTAGRDHGVHRWELQPDGSLANEQRFEGHGDTIRWVSCVSDTRFVSLGADALVAWDTTQRARTARSIALDGRAEPGVEHARGAEVQAVAASPRSDAAGHLAVATRDAMGRNRLLLLSDGGRTVEASIDLRALRAHAVTFSADARTVAVAGEVAGEGDDPPYGAVATFDVRSPASEPRPLTWWREDGWPPLRAVAMLDDEHYVASGDDGTLLEISGDGPPVSRGNTGYDIRSVAYSSDGRLIIAGDNDGTLACYAARGSGGPSGKVVLERSVDSIAVGADGTVAVGTFDNDVFVFRAVLRDSRSRNACAPATWRRSELRAHDDPVSSVALGLDGKLLVSASLDGTLALWDVDRSRLLGRLDVGTTPKTSTAVAVDGRDRVIVAGSGTAALRFPLEREQLRRRLCELAGRSLTGDERTVFLSGSPDTAAGECGTS